MEGSRSKRRTIRNETRILDRGEVRNDDVRAEDVAVEAVTRLDADATACRLLPNAVRPYPQAPTLKPSTSTANVLGFVYLGPPILK